MWYCQDEADRGDNKELLAADNLQAMARLQQPTKTDILPLEVSYS